MLNNPQDRALHALRRLSTTEDFQTVMEWIRDEQESLNDRMLNLEGHAMIKHQGAALTLKSLCKVVKEADSIAAKRSAIAR